MKLIEEDALYVAKKAKELGLSGKSFLITGATGMIGRAFVRALCKVTPNKNIYVLGFDYNDVENIFKSTGANLCSFDKLDEIKGVIDFVVHLASPTSPSFLKNKPVETISFIYESTKKMLDFARLHNSKMLFVSSMEVYGEINDENIKNEYDLGIINLRNARNSYPESKRLCELLCYSYSKEFDLNVCSARLSQTFGAGTSPNDPRVFGYFGRCVINNENIVLKTKGDSFGNYCYIADSLVAFLYILAKGVSGETYNVVGDECRSTILDLATMVSSRIANDNIAIEFDLSNAEQYPRPTKLNMSNKKIKALGWMPKHSLKDMFIRMINSWQE